MECGDEDVKRFIQAAGIYSYLYRIALLPWIIPPRICIALISTLHTETITYSRRTSVVRDPRFCQCHAFICFLCPRSHLHLTVRVPCIWMKLCIIQQHWIVHRKCATHKTEEKKKYHFWRSGEDELNSLRCVVWYGSGYFCITWQAAAWIALPTTPRALWRYVTFNL